jgi:hypothetical protein
MPHGRARRAPRNSNSTRRRLAAVAGFAVVLLWSCQDDLTRYYPLEAGFAWQYRVSLTQGGSLTTTTADVANLQPADVLGRKAVPQRSEMFGQSLVRYLVKDWRGVFEYAQQAGSDGTPVGKDAPNYVLRVPVADGTTWSSTWQSTPEGRQVSFPTVKAIAATDETVMVPAGTFSGCIRLKVIGTAQVNLTSGPATIKVQGDEWYAPEIGFIKGAFRETVNSGEVTTELGMDLASFARPR